MRCGREYTRPRKADRQVELRCVCGGTEFTVYELERITPGRASHALEAAQA